ncbi:MAG: amino acid ABC transporter permease [Ardenticatenales bacterium]|nr:amino acid ABC transporter permease [Ardenticatenales bacterium]
MAVRPEQEQSVMDIWIEGRQWERFPWWFVGILGAILFMIFKIVSDPQYTRAYNAILPGLRLTLYITVVAFLAAVAIGLIAGLGRISQNFVLRNLATLYIEFVRGVPTLVLISTVAFVIVPGVANLLGIQTPRDQTPRAIAALAVIYGAFLAEVFRAGIESIPPGQMEAARSLGMTHFQAMIYIILPQAIRNMLPALGNDLIAMLKDSSLVSVLAVREITQEARLYSGSTFRFSETYLILTLLYLIMTIILSLLLQWYQRRLRNE